MRFRTLVLAVVAVLALVSVSENQGLAYASQQASTVTINPGQLAVLQQIADYYPALKNRPFGGWTQTNLENACGPGFPAFGVNGCDGAGYVTQLYLDSTASGQLSDAFAGLTSLFSFTSVGGVNGTLPSSWSALTTMSTLQIVNSGLTGTIPTSWSAMHLLRSTTLKFAPGGSVAPWNSGVLFNQYTLMINLDGYNFGPENSLPTEFFNSPTMINIAISNCIWDGSVPLGLLSNSKLAFISFSLYLPNFYAASASSVSIPGDWSSMASLKSVTFNNLPWTGVFPTVLTNTTYWLQMTNLPYYTGSISQAIIDSTALTNLIVQNISGLTGTVPSFTVPADSKLTTFSLDRLPLTGTINPSFFSSPVLTTLSVTNMPSLDRHTLPYSTTSACKVTTFNVTGCAFTGVIPSYLVSNCSMLTFDVSNNQLQGTLPPTWVSTYATAINFTSNLLTGTIPSSYAVTLIFHAANNNFGGYLPSTFYRNMVEFDISGNKIDLCANASTITTSSFAVSRLCKLYPQTRALCDCAGASWPATCAYTCPPAPPSEPEAPIQEVPIYADPVAPVSGPTASPSDNPSAPSSTGTPSAPSSTSTPSAPSSTSTPSAPSSTTSPSTSTTPTSTPHRAPLSPFEPIGAASTVSVSFGVLLAALVLAAAL